MGDCMARRLGAVTIVSIAKVCAEREFKSVTIAQIPRNLPYAAIAVPQAEIGQIVRPYCGFWRRLRPRSILGSGQHLCFSDSGARMNNGSVDLASFVRSIPDFPKPGILFRDITPLLAAPEALGATIDRLAAPFLNEKIDAVAAAEARGFIFAAPLALRLNVAFVPVRKPGKLPGEKHAFHYELEYGTDTLEIHTDGVSPGQRVLLVDDLLATGGTMQACCRLVEKAGGEVAACAFVIELTGLGGAARLQPHHVLSLLKYE